MNNEQLYALVRSLPVSNYKDHGPLVKFSDIITACRLRGADDTKALKASLRQLEAEGLLTVVVSTTFEELFTGVKVH